MTKSEIKPVPLYCRSFGDGERQVLAVHCTIAHSGAWKGLANELRSEATFVAPDMLSHGRSPDWDETGDFPDIQACSLRPLLNQPMDLIGHSFGGLMALRLAVENPEMVRSLTLVEPVFFRVAKDTAPDLIQKNIEINRPVIEALDAGDHENAARLFNRSWGDGGTRWADMPETSRAAMTRGIHILPASDTAVWKDSAGLLKPGVLEGLKMPVLLLRGAQSDEIIRIVNDGLAARIPDAENHVIEEAGHMVPITHPKETAAHLRTLFKKAPIG